MKHREHTSIFLLELMIDLLMFALCAAICVGLFAQARSMSRESRQLTDAVYLAQSAAETLRLGLPVAETQDGYEIAAEETKQDGVTHFAVTISLDGKEIYSLPGAYPTGVQP